MKKAISLFFLILSCTFSYSENYGWVNSIQGLRLRSAPDLNAKVLTLIPQAETVQILIVDKTKKVVINNFRDHWMNIKYGDHSGWAFGAYISDIKILNDDEYEYRNSLLTGKMESEKDAIRDFFRQKLEGVARYKYELENDLPAKVQLFVEIIRFDEKNYEEEVSYDFSKMKYNYKKLYNEYAGSIKSGNIKFSGMLFTYPQKYLKLETKDRLKYISYDGFYQFNFSRNLIYFKKRLALIATIMYYYDNEKLPNSLVYCNQSVNNLKYYYKDEGIRYNRMLENIFLKSVNLLSVY